MIKLIKHRAHDMHGDESRWKEPFAQSLGGRPAKAAELMLFLVSSHAAYITCTIVTIDGSIAAHGSIIKTRNRALTMRAALRANV
jgi:hypothetical protein